MNRTKQKKKLNKKLKRLKMQATGATADEATEESAGLGDSAAAALVGDGEKKKLKKRDKKAQEKAKAKKVEGVKATPKDGEDTSSSVQPKKKRKKASFED